MARLLYVRDSVSFASNGSRRHLRLCRKFPDTESLIASLIPKRDDLILKKGKLETASEETENTNDDIALSNIELGNGIRDVYDDCKKYDRNNTGESVLMRIFPDGTFSEIVSLPVFKKLGETDKITTRIESFGSDHAIYPHANALRQRSDAVRSSIQLNDEAKKAESQAEADLEIAKHNLVLQYEHNYLDARRKFGTDTAEKLFPVLKTKVKAKTTETSALKTDVAKA